ncbi:MAG: hypothetical protein M3Q31_09195 [Actinomycetota bacterium]|nr:hypothetical protein [Actinomycetota bacterium]
MASSEQALARALDGLDPETRQALARALERGEVELEGGGWGSMDDGSGCLLSLAAWELGLERGESLMRRSVAAVQVPALFDAWWDEVLTREGDVVRTRRTVREALGEMLFRGLAAPRDELPRGDSAFAGDCVTATCDDGAVGAQEEPGRMAARP